TQGAAHLDAAHTGQAHVDDDDVGDLAGGDELERVFARARFSDHAQIRVVPQDGRYPLADYRMIIYQEDADHLYVEVYGSLSRPVRVVFRVEARVKNSVSNLPLTPPIEGRGHPLQSVWCWGGRSTHGFAEGQGTDPGRARRRGARSHAHGQRH